MQLLANINIKKLEPPISYPSAMMLVGSCFTEHIGNYLADVKFKVLQNPNGIVFNPASICSALISYIDKKVYTADEIFYFNECWHSWQHHSRFSHPNRETCLQAINQSQNDAHKFLKNADWLILTLGSSFVYKLSENIETSLKKGVASDGFVANCHKLPAQSFAKELLKIDEIIFMMDDVFNRLKTFNPNLKLMLTISPVRHLRDGVIENNRSKARLIEAVNQLLLMHNHAYYFPAYELVVDVLRDYRFYDIDLAHPNYAATSFVLEHFAENCISNESQLLMEEIRKITVAYNHKPFNPQSQQHKNFLKQQFEKVCELKTKYPFLNFEKESDYFRASMS